MAITTIEFEDHGQSCLEIDIDEYGEILHTRPDPDHYYQKFLVANEDELEPGGNVELMANNGDFTTVKFPIKNICES